MIDIPHNLDAEKSVLGSIFKSPERIDLVIGILTPEAFFHQGYKNVFAAMVGVTAEGLPTDLLVIRDWIEKKNQLESVSGVSGLSSLTEVVPTGVHIEHYAAIVAEKYRLRRIIETCNQTIDAIRDSESNSQTIGGDLLAEVDSILANNSTGAISIKEIASRELVPQKRVKIGFKNIDCAINDGLAPSDFLVIGARPKIGKSQFALQVVLESKVVELDGSEREARSLFISLEMGALELECRLIAKIAKMPGNAVMTLRTGKAQEYTKNLYGDNFDKARATLRTKSYLIETRPMSINGLSGLIAKHRKEIDFAVIDYLQLLSPTYRKQSEYDKVTEASRICKTLAQRFEIPVIAISQLSRPMKGQETRKPSISDLRSSGQIEQDADAIILLHRQGTDSGNEVDISVALEANRNGITLEETYLFNREQGRFSQNHSWE